MAKITKDARVLLKRSLISGDEPLPGSNDDHTTWTDPLMIYKGEMFVNTTDNKAWIRTENGMAEMAIYDNSTGLIPPEHLPPSEYNTSLDPTLEVPNDVGGIKDGTTVSQLYGKTYIEMFDELLFPTVLAYVNTYESSSLTGRGSDTIEVGTTIAPNVTASFNPGSINNGDDTSGPNLKGDVHPYGQYVFKLPNGTTDSTISATSNSQSYTYSSYVINFGNNIWSVDILYDAGTGLYYDNKGNEVTNLDGDRVSGTITSNTGNVVGRRYAWYGYGAQYSAPTTSNDIRSLPYDTFLSSSNTGTFTITIPAGTQEVYFYIPAGKTVNIKYVETNVDVKGSFTDPPYNSPESINVEDVGGTNQSYEKWVGWLGTTGYPDVANYQVTIT